MTMPYTVGPPVRLPTDFFGRQRQTRQFYETLAGAQTQCVSVLGLRRAGKTSFLRYVAHPEVVGAHLPDAPRYAMVYVDMSACHSAADFYRRVYQKLIGGLPSAPPGVPRSPQTADAYAVESLLYEYRGRRVVVFMDEFDQLRTGGFGDEFMTELRALAGVWDYELAYVTASYWDLHRLGNFVGLAQTSPFYNIFFPTPIYLSGLSPAELEALVRVPARRVGVEATDEDVAFVRHYAGTLPFFVQAVAAVWLTHKLQGRRPDEREVIQRLVSEMWPYYEQWWRHFNDVERDMLAAVAQERPVERLPYSPAEIAAAGDRLGNYGVIARTGSQWGVDSALLSHWLREYTGRVQRATPPAAGAWRNGRSESRVMGETYGPETEALLERIATAGRRVAPPAAPGRGEDGRPAVPTAALGAELAAAGDWLVTPSGDDLLAADDSGYSFLIRCDSWQGQREMLRQARRVVEQLAPEMGGVLLTYVAPAHAALVAEAVLQAMPHHADYLGLAERRGDRLDFRFRRPGAPAEETRLTVLLLAAG